MANGDDWGTEIQLKDYADLSFETRELLRKNQHGIDQKVIGEADAWWGDRRDTSHEPAACR